MAAAGTPQGTCGSKAVPSFLTPPAEKSASGGEAPGRLAGWRRACSCFVEQPGLLDKHSTLGRGAEEPQEPGAVGRLAEAGVEPVWTRFSAEPCFEPGRPVWTRFPFLAYGHYRWSFSVLHPMQQAARTTEAAGLEAAK